MSEPKYLRVEAGVRYWEDAIVNGVADEAGDLIPCRSGQYWCPIIDLDSGRIVEWPEGTTADIHYKVCDDGAYRLLDTNWSEICRIEGYVPPIMSPEDSGYGDYIIMKVDGSGAINKWRVDLDRFPHTPLPGDTA